MRRWVTAVVVYRRSAELSLSRQLTSSLQSPVRSAVSTGVDLVPLLDAQAVQDSSDPDAPYFVIEVPSSSSRVSSASQYSRKFAGPGREAAVGPDMRRAPVVAEILPSTPVAYFSAPGVAAETSSATHRPVSLPLIGPACRISHVRASRRWLAGWSPSSLHMM